MLEEEKQKLLNRDSKYLSIGITEGGERFGMIGVPWVQTVHAYNMKTPDVYISPEDINDSSIMDILHTFSVIGCYIFVSLEDYTFLSDFPEIRDLNIMCGRNVRNLEFLRNLTECRMFLLHDAELENLDAIIDLNIENKSILGAYKCVALYNCSVQDLSRFEKEKNCYFF